MTQKRRVTRVIMFPGHGNKNENRYIDVLVKSIRAAGVEVESWNKHFSRQRGDIFHVHWPELIADIRGRKYQLLRGQWIAFQFFRTIQRIKRHGGRVVWTVHDLVPHNKRLRGSAFLERLMSRFISHVDVALSLTSAGIGEIKQAIPALNGVPHFVTRHPHYKGILGPGVYNQDVRARLGISQDQKVFAFVGTLRPDKRPDLVVQAFRDLPINRAFLIMAGSASPDMAQTITELTKGRPNVRLDLRRVSEEEVVELYSGSDILVFPGTNYFNSGTMYTALSLGVPVIAAWSPSNCEIQNIVGAQWLYLYQGTFSRELLEDASRVLIQRDTAALCDLTAFSPEVCASEHIHAYENALSRPRSAQ
jgi:glycosyltransferase involved in cell wall biosynthesis